MVTINDKPVFSIVVESLPDNQIAYDFCQLENYEQAESYDGWYRRIDGKNAIVFVERSPLEDAKLFKLIKLALLKWGVK